MKSRSRVLLRRALFPVWSVVLGMLCVLGVASPAFAAAAVPSVTSPLVTTWHFDDGADGWGPSTSYTAASNTRCYGGSGGCWADQFSNQYAITSPGVAVTTNSAGSVAWSATVEFSGAAGESVAADLTVDGTAHALTGSCTVGAGAANVWTLCTFNGYTSAPPGGTAALKVTPSGTGSYTLDEISLIQTFTVAAAPAPTPIPVAVGGTGSVSFPVLDMTSLGANVSSFFSMMAPALWLIGGISIGGLLLSRARNFF